MSNSTVNQWQVDGKDVYALIMEMRQILDKKPIEVVNMAALTIAVNAINPNLDAARLVDAVHAASHFIANYTGITDGTVN